MKIWLYCLLLLPLMITLTACPKDVRYGYQHIALHLPTDSTYYVLSESPYILDSILPAIYPSGHLKLITHQSYFYLFSSFEKKVKLKDYISSTPDKAIYFYLFRKEVIETKTWNEIRNSRLFLRKFTIKEQDVDNENVVHLYYP